MRAPSNAVSFAFSIFFPSSFLPRDPGASPLQVSTFSGPYYARSDAINSSELGFLLDLTASGKSLEKYFPIFMVYGNNGKNTGGHDG